MTLSSMQYVDDIAEQYEEEGLFEKAHHGCDGPMPVGSSRAAIRAARRGMSHRPKRRASRRWRSHTR